MIIKNHKKIPTLITKEPPILVPYYLRDSEGNLDLQSWDGKTGFLEKEWRCYYKDKDIEFSLVINRGFKTNLGSVPPPFSIAIEDGGELSICYIIHDFFYGTWLVPKWKADDILYTTRKLLGGNFFANQAVHFAVAHFGQSHWDAAALDDEGKTDYTKVRKARTFGKLNLKQCEDSLADEISKISLNLTDYHFNT